FGEHGDRDDATNGVAQPAWRAHGDHDLPQQVLVSDVFSLAEVAGAFDNLRAETGDLIGRHGAEIVVELVAGFDLLAVDQQGPGAAERVAVLVEVAEKLEAAIV